MRCESKNKDLKGCVVASFCRINPWKTIAMKCQLQANYRKQLNRSVDETLSYEKGNTSNIIAMDLSDFQSFANLLPIQTGEAICVVDSLRFRGREIIENSIISLFIVHKMIIGKTEKLFLISRDITKFSEYDEHYQAYNLDATYLSEPQSWRCLSLENLQFRFISRIVENANGDLLIPKRWI